MLTEERIGILFSGGLDSSIITKLILDEFTEKKIEIVAVGMKNSYDINNSIQRATELKFSLSCCYLDKDSVRSSIDFLISEKIVKKIGDLSIAVPLQQGMKFLNNSSAPKMVVLGQGADELFGGYNRYSLLYNDSKIKDLEKSMELDLENLIKIQSSMEKKIASIYLMTAIYPFLSPTVIKYAKAIPVSKHLRKTKNGSIIRKHELRQLAMNLNLSESIANQPKKALQYGSGTVRILRKIARDDGCSNLREWFINKYPVES